MKATDFKTQDIIDYSFTSDWGDAKGYKCIVVGIIDDNTLLLQKETDYIKGINQTFRLRTNKGLKIWKV